MQYPLKKTITLSVALARAHFKLRNEGIYLGIAWYLLNPLLLFAILFFVFSDRLGSSIPYYPAYLFLGIIMFNYKEIPFRISLFQNQKNRRFFGPKNRETVFVESACQSEGV